MREDVNIIDDGTIFDSHYICARCTMGITRALGIVFGITTKVLKVLKIV